MDENKRREIDKLNAVLDKILLADPSEKKKVFLLENLKLFGVVFKVEEDGLGGFSIITEDTCCARGRRYDIVSNDSITPALLLEIIDDQKCHCTKKRVTN